MTNPTQITIATHNGSFHADDAFGVAMILLLYPDCAVIRTRDADVIAKCDFAVDVGGVYNAQLGRFDHHQKGGAGVRLSGIPYASAGLVWKILGELIVIKLTNDQTNAAEVVDSVDRGLISDIDGVDCGVDGIPKGPAMISSIIGSMNPKWNEEHPDFDGQFRRAVEMAKTVLTDAIRDVHAALKAREIVDGATLHVDGRVVELRKSCPWGRRVHEKYPDALFVVFPGEMGDWRVRDVPDPEKPGTFESKKRLPLGWGGLEGKSLDAVTGVPGGIFCHNGRFICGHNEREGALKMAELAVKAA